MQALFSDQLPLEKLFLMQWDRHLRWKLRVQGLNPKLTSGLGWPVALVCRAGPPHRTRALPRKFKFLYATIKV
jgi:hypothetical protein